MMTAKTNGALVSNHPDQTRSLGAAIGADLAIPLIITLSGDLASGKTVFVQGLAAGLEVPREYYITSPSYTLINEYPGRLPLCHADLYRLADHSDITEIGLEEILEQQCVVAIEWPERLDSHRFDNQLSIDIQILAPQTRRLELIAYGLPAVNLLRGVKKNKEIQWGS
ncbi:MAG: tRNA threonylcarbamoyladenosine biosynthesis protein TsaE [Olavius algarvensis Delta 4 endosymbiont]|nr:MAG: tRNA threonylcarbamoyladenosine biosynthesis protein TsaE [Olavius algarvensis Delta 4 endosymbiont]